MMLRNATTKASLLGEALMLQESHDIVNKEL